MKIWKELHLLSSDPFHLFNDQSTNSEKYNKGKRLKECL